MTINKNEAILKRQKYSTRFKNEDMDFMPNWTIAVSQIVGMSPSQAFNAVVGIEDANLPLSSITTPVELGAYEPGPTQPQKVDKMKMSHGSESGRVKINTALTAGVLSSEIW